MTRLVKFAAGVMTSWPRSIAAPAGNATKRKSPQSADGRRSSVSGICRETRFYAGRRGAAPSDSSGQCASLSARGFALLFARLAVGCCRRLHFCRRHDKRARTQSPRESTVDPACNRQHIVAKGTGRGGGSHHIPGRDGCTTPLCRYDAGSFAAGCVLANSHIGGPLTPMQSALARKSHLP